MANERRRTAVLTAEELQRATPGSVLAAMSGGVDSSTMAALLSDQGFTVEGITLHLIGADVPGGCDMDTDPNVADARDAAQRMGIPHRAVDLSAHFARCVIDPFCADYLDARTPNPCIACNKHLKFGALHDLRRTIGADYLSTGHYARRTFNDHTKRYELRKAADPTKDQSYVLYQLTQDQLAHTLFPLEALSKEQVRATAAQHGLPNASKSESQDICFVPDGDHAGFIARRTGVDLEPGPILATDGTVLGTHHGLAAYTVGQRKGLGVAWSEPLYVLKKDKSKNTLVVGPLASQGVRLVRAHDVSLVSGVASEEPLDGRTRLSAKTNYRMKEAPAVAWLDDEGLLCVEFDQPVRACAPGQSLVVYDDDRVVGGGIVCEG